MIDSRSSGKCVNACLIRHIHHGGELSCDLPPVSKRELWNFHGYLDDIFNVMSF